MTCTEDRDGAIIDMDTAIRDLGDVRRSPTELTPSGNATPTAIECKRRTFADT